MSLYQVPPPEEAEPFSALQATRRRLTLWLAGLSSIACMLVWWYDGSNGLNSPWASVAVPIIAAGLVLGGLVIWLRPLWHNQAAALCNASVATYFIGSLITTTEAGGPDGLYEVASNAQFMPLLYLAAFVTMTRGAPRLSWLTYTATVLSYLWLYGFEGAPGGDHIGHFWFMLLITHPIFILALSYVSVLHTRLKSAEVEVHTSRERFLAMLSHEIRTPLQAMLGSIDLLALKLRGGAEIRALDRLRGSAIQLDAHLRDVTEFTRLENPALRIQAEPVDLVRLLHELREEWLPQAQAKGLNLSLNIAPADQAALQQWRADATRVRQIVGNLVSNALKYTLVGGVTIHAGLSARQRGHLSLVVEDSGIGIAPQHLETVFQPYVRLEDARALKVEGSGLGLAVVRRLVERLGGSLYLDSHPDRGSRFTVELPMADNG